jgi:predicted nucleic acid-binding protein
MVPAIIYYELKRELLRAGKTFGITRLDAFTAAASGRYLPLSDEALRLGAELWALSRQSGKPTSDPRELDVDVLLAAQALSFGPSTSEITVVTGNAKHLSQFVDSRHWRDIG